MNKELNTFYFSSDKFVSVAATSIVSLLENNAEFEKITIYYADDGISDINKNKLIGLVKKYNREIIFIDVPSPSDLFDFQFKDRYQMGHSYMRMAIGSLLPSDVKRVLCLDSDTLVVGDLMELWNIDMEDNVLAGVNDCINISKYKNRFFLDDNDIYCNAGVFLVDLDKWRSLNIEKIIATKIKEKNGNIFFFEQTLMNYACKGKIKSIHPKYNSYTLFFAFNYCNLIKWRKPINFYTPRNIEEAKETPTIIHFTRNFYMRSRPWVEECEHPWKDIYIKYKQFTPWEQLEEYYETIGKKIKYIVVHIIPQNLLTEIISLIYNDIRPKMLWKNE